MASAGKASPTAASAAGASPRTLLGVHQPREQRRAQPLELGLERAPRRRNSLHHRLEHGVRDAVVRSPTCATKASASSRAREDASEAHRRPRRAARRPARRTPPSSPPRRRRVRPAPRAVERRAARAGARRVERGRNGDADERIPATDRGLRLLRLRGALAAARARVRSREAGGARRERRLRSLPSRRDSALGSSPRSARGIVLRTRPRRGSRRRPRRHRSRRRAAPRGRRAAGDGGHAAHRADAVGAFGNSARRRRLADARSAPPPTRATPRPESREASTPTRRPPLAATVLGRSNSRVSVGPGPRLGRRGARPGASSADAARSRSSSSCTPAGRLARDEALGVGVQPAGDARGALGVPLAVRREELPSARAARPATRPPPSP